jgi:hypothetical protein
MTMKDELEAFIDKEGLAKALQLIEDICQEKADHVRSNWHDVPAARAWEKDADKIAGVVARLLNA